MSEGGTVSRRFLVVRSREDCEEAPRLGWQSMLTASLTNVGNDAILQSVLAMRHHGRDESPTWRRCFVF